MTLHILDHVFFFLIAVVMPIHGYFWLRKRSALIQAGHTELRMVVYRATINEEWALTALLLGLWFGLGRSGADLGLGLASGLPALAGYALAALICCLQLIQMKSVMATPESLADLKKQLGELSFLTPHTTPERRTFNFVSVTAGICEELLFRGFGIAYLTALLGVSFWVAALISSVVFGLAHAYQGPMGFARAGGLGLIFATLYGLTGALWAPIVVHAVQDLTVGRMSFAAFSQTSPENTSPKLVA